MPGAGEKNQNTGRSRGGLSSKIHTLCNKKGNPLRFIFTGGERNDCTQGENLLSGMECKSVIADKGYDTAKILSKIRGMKAEIVIPSSKTRKQQREYDKEKYRERNLIERLFNKMKRFRRFATRYEKLSLAFEGFVYFIGIWLWIK